MVEGKRADEWALQIQREAKALAQDEDWYLDVGEERAQHSRRRRHGYRLMGEEACEMLWAMRGGYKMA